MSTYWGRHGDSWEPEGGEQREWRDLRSGDMIPLFRAVWRVREVRPVPVADWEECDREHYDSDRRLFRTPPASEEEWDKRPLYLTIEPEGGGRRRHHRIRPWASYRQAWVLHPHYPVCRDCGQPWPCPELDITHEVRKQAAEVDRLASILPGCCWSCGGPVTARHSSITFDGENLLLPGAPSPVFHLRGKGGCHATAMKYEEKWVAAAEGRHATLRCPGKIIMHADGGECDQGDCPGPRAYHKTRTEHVITHRGAILRWVRNCPRCSASADTEGRQWADDDTIRSAFPNWYATR